MSADLSKNEGVGDELDLNSDAVPREEEREVCVFSGSDSKVIVTVSAAESLTEPLNGQVQISDVVVDKVRCCSGAGEANPVEELIQRSDGCADGAGAHMGEGNFDVEAVHAGVIEEGAKVEMKLDEGVADGASERFHASMSHKIGVLQNGDKKTEFQVAERVERPTTTVESSFEEAITDTGGDSNPCSEMVEGVLEREAESLIRGSDLEAGDGIDALMQQNDGILEVQDGLTVKIEKKLECPVTITESSDECNHDAGEREIASNADMAKDDKSEDGESDEKVGVSNEKAGEVNDLSMLENDDIFEEEVQKTKIVKDVECAPMITKCIDEGVQTVCVREVSMLTNLNKDNGSVEGVTDEKAGDVIDALMLQKTDILNVGHLTGEIKKKLECSAKMTESLDEQDQIVIHGEEAVDTGFGCDDELVNRDSGRRAAGDGIGLMLLNNDVMEKEDQTGEPGKEVGCSVVTMEFTDVGHLTGEVKKNVECSAKMTESLDEQDHIVSHGEEAVDTGFGCKDEFVNIESGKRAGDGTDLMLLNNDVIEKEDQKGEPGKELECLVVTMESTDVGHLTGEVKRNVECSAKMTESLDEQDQIVSHGEEAVDTVFGCKDEFVNIESGKRADDGTDLMLLNNDVIEKENKKGKPGKEVEHSAVTMESTDEDVKVVHGQEAAINFNLVRENAAVDRGDDGKSGGGLDGLVLQKADVMEEKDRKTAVCTVVIEESSDEQAQVVGGVEAAACSHLETDIGYLVKGNDDEGSNGINVGMSKDMEEEEHGEVLKKVDCLVMITDPPDGEIMGGREIAAHNGSEIRIESVDKGGLQKSGDASNVSMSQIVGKLENKDHESVMEVGEKAEGSVGVMESSIELTQVLIGEKAEVMDNYEVSIPDHEVWKADTWVGKSSSLEENLKMEVDTSSVSIEKNGVINGDPFVGVESLSDQLPLSGRNPSINEEFPCTENDKQMTVSQAEKALSIKVDDVNEVDVCFNSGIPEACVKVIPDSVAEAVEGLHAADSCPCPHGELEPDSSQVVETFGPLLNRNLDVGILVTDPHSSAHKDHKMETHVSEPVTCHGIEDQKNDVCCTNVRGGLASEAEVSQVGGYGSNTGSHVVNLVTCPIMNGNLNSGGEIVMEDNSMPHEPHCQIAEVRDVGADIGSPMSNVEENAAFSVTQLGSDGTQRTEIEEQDMDTGQSKSIEKKNFKRAPVKVGSTVKEYHASYCLPAEKEGEFSLSDLVWGKVRSHPWWPGQIFDPSDSSEQAMKYYKTNSYLVAYFGDQTFAWNEASLLRPFRAHFLQMEKQSNSEVFHNAVNCALNEVSRRVELGLSCSCTPDKAYSNVKFQRIENSGIRDESSTRACVDQMTSVMYFEPNKLVEYIRALARFPSGGVDRLELVIAQAQVLAFYRSKGYYRLPEFQICGDLLEEKASEEKNHSIEVIENSAPVPEDEKVLSGIGKLKSRESSSHKRKHVSEDNDYASKKERSLSELMSVQYSSDVDDEYCRKAVNKSATSSSGKKRKDVDCFYDESALKIRKKRGSKPGTTDTVSPKLKQSFKVGDCILRVASQLTGSPPILKCDSEKFQAGAVKMDGSCKKPSVGGFDILPYTPTHSRRRRVVTPIEYSSPLEMLSQLCLAARDPMKGYSFLTVIVSFFSEFRDSISLDRSSSGKLKESLEETGGGKAVSKRKRLSVSNAKSAETFDFEDMKDTYWTDMIIQSNPAEQSSRRDLDKSDGSLIDIPVENEMPTGEPETSFELSPNFDSDYQFFDGNLELAAARPVCHMDDKCKEEFSPTALILNFTEIDSIPSETNLNRIFSRFGPLKESETEVLRKTNRARVVFKKSADAEVAFSSAGKFSIFGPALVSYSLRYLSSVPFKAPSRATKQGRKNATAVGSDTA